MVPGTNAEEWFLKILNPFKIGKVVSDDIIALRRPRQNNPGKGFKPGFLCLGIVDNPEGIMDVFENPGNVKGKFCNSRFSIVYY